MKNLIVCCDGTWNTMDQRSGEIPCPTNVVKIHNAVSFQNKTIQQIKYYHPGVGTDGVLDKIRGGAFGIGLSLNIKSAYKWLAENYVQGDQIFLFGFSRGAFTVRSLAGMITKCGLLNLRTQNTDPWLLVDGVYEKYREGRNVQIQPDCQDVHVHFVGVWDTVGALGIPDTDFELLNVLDNPKEYSFHDTSLSQKIRHARHAIALDETRASFAPTLWTDVSGNVLTLNHSEQTVKQMWFPGVHSDVGGGYAECGLSDGALRWMITEAVGYGLEVNGEMLQQIKPNPQGVMHESVVGKFKSMKTMPRNCPAITRGNVSAGIVHQSAFDRQSVPPISQTPYRTTYVLPAGQSQECAIYAAQRWNDTGIYLEAEQTYTISASGHWLDSTIKTDYAGVPKNSIHLGYAIGSVLGSLENAFKKITDNSHADFVATRRNEAYPWFALVCVIADGGTMGSNQMLEEHTSFVLDGKPIPVKKSGYLYCFANDAWGFYFNNHGSILLNVSCVSASTVNSVEQQQKIKQEGV